MLDPLYLQQEEHSCKILYLSYVSTSVSSPDHIPLEPQATSHFASC